MGIPNFNINDFITAAKQKAAELDKEDEKNRTDASIQSVANGIAVDTAPKSAAADAEAQMAAPQTGKQQA